MGRDVSLDIRLRPLDTKRFVGDFVRKFSAWIPEGAPVRTTRDVLQCALVINPKSARFKLVDESVHGYATSYVKDGVHVEWMREMTKI